MKKQIPINTPSRQGKTLELIWSQIPLNVSPVFILLLIVIWFQTTSEMVSTSLAAKC